MILWSHPPRVTFQPSYDPTMPGGLRSPIDLSKRPLASGEQITPHFTWTYERNAKENFGIPDTTFILTAMDIRGREIRASYTL